MNFADITQSLGLRQPPDLVPSFVTMACSALAGLDPAQYATQLAAALGATSVNRVGGGPNFLPHVLKVQGPTGTIVAFEGTRDFAGWSNYIVNSAWIRWATGPGRVYGAYWVIFNGLRSVLLDILAGPGPLYLTGHSLGAAVAALFARWADDIGSPVKVVHSFGSPSCVDQWWRDNYHVRNWSLNHPMDPVPLAPMSSILFLTNPREFELSRQAVVPTGIPWLLPAWADMGTGLFTVDDAAAFCAAAVTSPRFSPHQPWRYLADMFLAMNPAQQTTVTDLAVLLRNLGLFAPPPA